MTEFTFKLEEFFIDPSEERSVICEIDLVMIEPEQAPIIPSLSDPGEPGWPAEFKIHEIRLINNISCMFEPQTLTLNEGNFATFFTNGQDTLNNAYEWASEQ